MKLHSHVIAHMHVKGLCVTCKLSMTSLAHFSHDALTGISQPEGLNSAGM